MVNALSSKGEVTVAVVDAVVDEEETVIGAMGNREKLFDEYFAGFIVVEWVIEPGRRVMLKGSD